MFRFLGPVGLAAGAALGVVAAPRAEERLDASRGFLYAGQGAAAMGPNTSTLGSSFGVGAGALQLGLGIHRITSGFRARDLKRSITGLFDIVAGSAWMLRSVGVAPVSTTVVFAAATAVKAVYVNRATLTSYARKLAAWVRRGYGSSPSP